MNKNGVLKNLALSLATVAFQSSAFATSSAWTTFSESADSKDMSFCMRPATEANLNPNQICGVIKRPSAPAVKAVSYNSDCDYRVKLQLPGQEERAVILLPDSIEHKDVQKDGVAEITTFNVSLQDKARPNHLKFILTSGTNGLLKYPQVMSVKEEKDYVEELQIPFWDLEHKLAESKLKKKLDRGSFPIEWHKIKNSSKDDFNIADGKSYAYSPSDPYRNAREIAGENIQRMFKSVVIEQRCAAATDSQE